MTDEQFDALLKRLEERDAKREKTITQRYPPAIGWWRRWGQPLVAAMIAIGGVAVAVWTFAGDHLVTTRSRGDGLEERIQAREKRDKVHDRAILYQDEVQRATYGGVKALGDKFGVKVPELPRRPALDPENGEPK